MGSEKKLGRPSDEAKRAAIIEAASLSFFNVGFAATAIEQVAANAGVSKVTIYNHFGDKRGLFAASVDRECENMRGHFSIDFTGGEDLPALFRRIGEAMVAFLSRPEMIQFDRRIAAETEHDPEIGAAFLNAGPHRMKSAFIALLDRLVSAGRLQIEDTGLAAEQFVSMCKGMGDLERRFGAEVDPQRDQDRIAGAVDVFLKAYSR
ncbi:TetR family transcriptional regulator [Altererythrobacter aquaemixtae]|uniref:TetR family transcriptional regulator n=1 Tax=Pontixanthobacter aquaemixtae TaxID=1958940 RepID=A0A844ZUP2_9SPHN|nr:TetR family transcriptional regulator [Pontixanthobacter aquaemixtae]